jgi:hypothetical protein
LKTLCYRADANTIPKETPFMNVQNAVELVVNAKPPLRESVRLPHPRLTELADTSATKRCAVYVGEDPESPDKSLALTLMFTLAALANRDKHFQQEALCLLGVRNVDASECERGDRREIAALARKRPLYDVDWYVKRHLPRTIARMAGDLRAIVDHPEALNGALQRNGKIAQIDYI